MALTEHDDVMAGMRAGMRRMAQGVTLVSGIDAAGARCVMTASSVTSVSMEPPSLLVCVNKTASMYEMLSARLPFCINVLPDGMQELSNLCAGAAEGEERFSLGDWRAAADSGIPYLEDAEAAFFCRPVQSMLHGTHLICIADLDAVRTASGVPNPLLYADGSYRRLL